MTENTATKSSSQKRRFVGVVVSNAMDKTIVVRVDRTKVHPIYQKRYKVSRKYKVHDAANQYHVGEKVTFIEGRPMSKDKKWYVLSKASEAKTV